MSDVNLLAVLVMAVVTMAFGALWYSPLLFGRAWVRLMGFSDADMQKAKEKGMRKAYFFGFVVALVMTYVLALFVNFVGASTFGAGAQVGFWVWLGFVATISLNAVLWASRPFKLYLLDNAHYLIALVVVGGVLAVWV